MLWKDKIYELWVLILVDRNVFDLQVHMLVAALKSAFYLDRVFEFNHDFLVFHGFKETKE